MRIAFSNIAWDVSEDDAIAGVLHAAGVDAVEIAPSKLWARPGEASADDIAAARAAWEKRGLRIVSLQALLFGRPELTLFDDEDSLERTIEYLGRIFRLAAGLGAGPLVFGSPRNRLMRGRPRVEAMDLAVAVFRRLGDVAQQAGVVLGLEPNAEDYGCDFVTNTTVGVEVVRRVDHPAVRLHLDAGVMAMNLEDPARAMAAAAPHLVHFHASEPNLAPVGSGGADHAAIGRALRSNGYRGLVSVEMRSGKAGGSVDAVKRALEVVTKAYGD